MEVVSVPYGGQVNFNQSYNCHPYTSQVSVPYGGQVNFNLSSKLQSNT